MKRIFLTSGLVLCMACPAFATGFTGNETQQQLNTACVDDNLGSDTGPVTLAAIWTNNRSTITLSTNTAANGWDGTSVVSQQTLYGVPNDTTHVYTMDAETDNLIDYTQYNIGSAGSGYTPLGKTATMTFNYNLPSISVPAGQADATPYVAATDVTNYEASSTTANRVFNGFWSADTGGTQYIDDAGAVLADGKSAAGNLANGATATWYAQYKCANADMPAVSLTGYDFNGWKTTGGANNSSATAAGACITDNTTVYASWTPHTGTISYNCNSAPGSNQVSDLTGNAPAGGTLTYDTVYTIAGNTGNCAYPGYTFAGWSCTDLSGATSGDVDYAAGAEGTYKVATQGAQITCTARWAKKTITPITWTDPDGGNDITDGSTSCVYDEAITLPTTPQRTGYTFGGWEVVPQTSQQ